MPDVLKSAFFASDPEAYPDLAEVLRGAKRLGPAGTSESAGPVLGGGLAVSKVQSALVQLGYASNPPTGYFDQQTAAVVSRFKTYWHLTPHDGVVGRFTLAALDYEMIGR